MLPDEKRTASELPSPLVGGLVRDEPEQGAREARHRRFGLFLAQNINTATKPRQFFSLMPGIFYDSPLVTGIEDQKLHAGSTGCCLRAGRVIRDM